MSKFASVHIASYGRSGSTLLMGLLNSIDGYTIRGENASALVHMARFRMSVETTSEQGSGSSTHPWYNDVDVGDIDRALRGLYSDLLGADGSSQVRGFKEIRYLRLSRAEFHGALDFIRSLDPPCAVIFNFRKHSAVVRSGFWARRNPLVLRFRMRRFERLAQEYATLHDDCCFVIRYREVVEGGQRLEELYAFLGETFDPRTHREVLARPHSYRAGGRNESYLRYSFRKRRQKLGRELRRLAQR